MSTPVFFHVDMDAFYASIEQRDDPALRGRPVIVGGRGDRGVVAAFSYESRRFGVHSAMPMRRALSLCPDAIVVPVRMRRYVEVSHTIMDLFTDYTPSVQAISIDEAFLDMTGTETLLGDPVDIARRIKEDVRGATELTISVGIGSSRFIAKLASDVDKPDGLHRVAAGTEESFVASLPLGALWGLGTRTRQRLERLGITTVVALRDQRIEFLRGHFGETGGEYLFRVARGEDPGIYTGRTSRHSISAERTFETDIGDAEQLRSVVRDMADEVIYRSIRESWRGRTIHVKYRFPPFETHTASRTLPRPVSGADELAEVAYALLEQRRNGRALRLLGVGIGGDAGESVAGQGDLFDEYPASRTTIDPTIVQLRERYGRSAITRASRIERRDESN
jgi:DNA polymerase-4